MNDIERYNFHIRRMQTGVRILMETGHSRDTEPKHLRVGVNSAMSDQYGLAKLLIAKGLITHDEYVKAMADAAEEEAARYQAIIHKTIGPNVSIGPCGPVN